KPDADLALAIVTAEIGKHEIAVVPERLLQATRAIVDETADDEDVHEVGGERQLERNRVPLRVVVLDGELVAEDLMTPIEHVTPSDPEALRVDRRQLGIRELHRRAKAILVVRGERLQLFAGDPELVAAEEAAVMKIQTEPVTALVRNAAVGPTEEV